MPATPSLRAFYILQLLTVNILGDTVKGAGADIAQFSPLPQTALDNPYNSWGEELYDGYDEHRKRAANRARVTLLFHAVLVASAFAIGLNPGLADLRLALPGKFVALFCWVTMHCGLKSNETDFASVRTISPDPVSTFNSI